jgi:DNA-binding CsgD family transcriptional regulator
MVTPRRTTVDELISMAMAARTPAEVGRSFAQALRPFGLKALFARTYRGACEHVVYSRISPAGWESAYDAAPFRQENFLTREMRRRIQPFVWSGVLNAPNDFQVFGLINSFDISDGIAAPVHGPGGYLGVTSLAFERLEELAPTEVSAISLAAVLLHQRMMAISPVGLPAGPVLSPRERDCLGSVADGKPDWEIAEVLGLAETTVLTHVQNARRKLGARTRSQAVALAILAGLI